MGERLTDKTFYVVSEDASSYLKVKGAHKAANRSDRSVVFITPDELDGLMFGCGSTLAFDTRMTDAFGKVCSIAQRDEMFLVPFEPEDISQLREYFYAR